MWARGWRVNFRFDGLQTCGVDWKTSYFSILTQFILWWTQVIASEMKKWREMNFSKFLILMKYYQDFCSLQLSTLSN